MEETFTFQNVAMYRSGMFGVSRTDCKTLVIKTGQKYAQYTNATRVEYLEKGKRTARAFMLDYDPWLRVLATKDAINPASPMDAMKGGGTVSRYTSCDPRYVTDFEDSIAHLVPVHEIGRGAREGAHLERCLALDGRV